MALRRSGGLAGIGERVWGLKLGFGGGDGLWLTSSPSTSSSFTSTSTPDLAGCVPGAIFPGFSFAGASLDSLDSLDDDDNNDDDHDTNDDAEEEETKEGRGAGVRALRVWGVSGAETRVLAVGG